jgi:hypothetical protein
LINRQQLLLALLPLRHPLYSIRCFLDPTDNAFHLVDISAIWTSSLSAQAVCSSTLCRQQQQAPIEPILNNHNRIPASTNRHFLSSGEVLHQRRTLVSSRFSPTRSTASCCIPSCQPRHKHTSKGPGVVSTFTETPLIAHQSSLLVSRFAGQFCDGPNKKSWLNHSNLTVWHGYLFMTHSGICILHTLQGLRRARASDVSSLPLTSLADPKLRSWTTPRYILFCCMSTLYSPQPKASTNSAVKSLPGCAA